MKTSFYLMLFLVSTCIYAQNLNGEYISSRTSYIDNKDSNDNFTENNRFDVFVFIEESNADGRVLVHDARIPEKVLMYKIKSLIDSSNNDDYQFYIYSCETLHTNKTEDTLVFYIKENVINLMIRDDNSSQVFHDLKLVDK